jgi:hypothetical protein
MEAHALSAGMQNYRVVYDLRYLYAVLLFRTECLSYYTRCGLHGILFVIKMVYSWNFQKDVFIMEDICKTAFATVYRSSVISFAVIMKRNAYHTVIVLNEIEVNVGHKITKLNSLIN